MVYHYFVVWVYINAHGRMAYGNAFYDLPHEIMGIEQLNGLQGMIARQTGFDEICVTKFDLISKLVDNDVAARMILEQ